MRPLNLLKPWTTAYSGSIQGHRLISALRAERLAAVHSPYVASTCGIFLSKTPFLALFPNYLCNYAYTQKARGRSLHSQDLLSVPNVSTEAGKKGF